MKALIALLLVTVSFSASARGRSESIADLTARLSDAMGFDDSVTQLKKGSSARALIVQKYLKDRDLKKVDEDFQYEEMVTSIPESDGTTLGTATAGAAEAFVADMIANMGFAKDGTDLSDATKAAMGKQAKQILERLEAAGAVFGFDSNGSGVCGVNYTTLYVIDVEEQTIHEFIFVSGPC
jgi:hypothetical protein